MLTVSLPRAYHPFKGGAKVARAREMPVNPILVRTTRAPGVPGDVRGVRP